MKAIECLRCRTTNFSCYQGHPLRVERLPTSRSSDALSFSSGSGSRFIAFARRERYGRVMFGSRLLARAGVRRTVMMGTALVLASTVFSASGAAADGSSSSTVRVLWPATVRPWVSECSQPLVRSADGNASPLNCNQGGLNVRAWRFYAHLGTEVMSLGRGASWGTIKLAMCADERNEHATFPEEQNAALLASDYYLWGVFHKIESMTELSC